MLDTTTTILNITLTFGFLGAYFAICFLVRNAMKDHQESLETAVKALENHSEIVLAISNELKETRSTLKAIAEATVKSNITPIDKFQLRD